MGLKISWAAMQYSWNIDWWCPKQHCIERQTRAPLDLDTRHTHIQTGPITAICGRRQ